jgi:hypothetical protein
MLLDSYIGKKKGPRTKEHSFRRFIGHGFSDTTVEHSGFYSDGDNLNPSSRPMTAAQRKPPPPPLFFLKK